MLEDVVRSLLREADPMVDRGELDVVIQSHKKPRGTHHFQPEKPAWSYKRAIPHLDLRFRHPRPHAEVPSHVVYCHPESR